MSKSPSSLSILIYIIIGSVKWVYILLRRICGRLAYRIRYNIDETGFQMGVTLTAKVVCGFETKQSHAKALQPGNREWVTSIVAINASGWALPAQIIFAASKHQSL